MKFRYSLEATRVIARELIDVIPYSSTEVILTNVPSVTSHVRKRGFDHAKLIAQDLSACTDMRYLELLRRSGQARQVGATRAKRLVQPKGSFGVINKDLVANRHIMIIDDVLTTGATIEAAATALKSAGAKSVSAVVFVRAK